MDKNYKQRAKRFFNKEGFYIVLLLCICITAIVATISFKKSHSVKETSKIENIQEEKINSKETEIELLKKRQKEIDEQLAVVDKLLAENITKSVDEAKAVSTSTEVKFSKPVEGKVLRGYTYPKPVKFNEYNVLFFPHFRHKFDYLENY